MVDEAERSVHDALMVSKDVLEKPAIVAGGGAPEAYAASKLREWTSTLSGREQLSCGKICRGLGGDTSVSGRERWHGSN